MVKWGGVSFVKNFTFPYFRENKPLKFNLLFENRFEILDRSTNKCPRNPSLTITRKLNLTNSTVSRDSRSLRGVLDISFGIVSEGPSREGGWGWRTPFPSVHPKIGPSVCV